jgi:hypothetical protein
MTSTIKGTLLIVVIATILTLAAALAPPTAVFGRLIVGFFANPAAHPGAVLLATFVWWVTMLGATFAIRTNRIR